MSAPASEFDHEYELKFAVSEEQAQAFVDATHRRLRPQVYDDSRPIAFARTTYLDTSDRRYLASSHAQVSRRLRIREYAGAARPGDEARLTGLSYLEYKESSAGQRRKARLRLSQDDIAEILQGGAEATRGQGLARNRRRRDGEGEAARLIAREFDAADQLVPQLTTWYRRQSLSGGDHIRVTLDTEIVFCRPIDLDRVGDEHNPAAPLDRVIGRPQSCLFEIKHRGAPPAWLTEAIALLGEQPRGGLSKYLLGMQAIDAAHG